MRRRLTGPAPRIRLPDGAVDTQMHVYLPGFPAQPGGPALPAGDAGPAAYESVMRWLGLGRVVVTQGNAHQADNANLLAAVAHWGARARGVAVVTGETTDAEMERLHAAGVRGARIMDLPGGAVGLARLAEVEARVRAWGWVLAVQFDGTRIRTHRPLLERIEARWILDHHGKFFGGVRPDGPEVAAVLKLIDRGNLWFKFAGCYESSRTGPPGYDDIGAVARVVAAHAPERVIWGTNWPHNLARRQEDYPDDAALLDVVGEWVPGERERTLLFRDNAAALFFA